MASGFSRRQLSHGRSGDVLHTWLFSVGPRIWTREPVPKNLATSNGSSERVHAHKPQRSGARVRNLAELVLDSCGASLAYVDAFGEVQLSIVCGSTVGSGALGAQWAA